LSWRAPILAMCAISALLYSFVTAAAEEQPASGFAFGVRMSGEQVPAVPRNVVGLAANVDYTFLKNFVLGAKVGFASSSGGVERYFSRGMGDSAVYLGDKAIWADEYSGLTLSGKVSVTTPTSPDSKVASMYYAAGQGLALKKKFSDNLTVAVGTSVTEYNFAYDTYVETDEGTVYNPRYTYSAKSGLEYKILKQLEFSIGGGVVMVKDFANQQYPVYILAPGISYSPDKNSSLDFEVETTMKDETESPTWGMPPASSGFFGSTTTVYRLAMSVSF
jgi:hypothetical protein